MLGMRTEGGKEWIPVGHESSGDVRNVVVVFFFLLIIVIISQEYTHIKTGQIEYFKYVSFSVFKLYFSKIDKIILNTKKINNCVEKWKEYVFIWTISGMVGNFLLYNFVCYFEF